jgi:dTDP-4-dehydrorhamnose reductase
MLRSRIILLIGKTGQLGSAILKDAQEVGYEVVAPSRQELDILNARSFQDAMHMYKPGFVINTAAFHNAPLCESHPETAFQVNCLAVKAMAEISETFNAWFISFSTDYVFSGENRHGFMAYKESDAPKPLQVYGLSKLSGEYAALMYKRSIIIRTSGLYNSGGSAQKGGNCVNNRIEDSKRNSRNRIEVSNDQTVSPTYACDLSKAVLQLINHPQTDPGIYHLVNEGYCTWYEFTKEIFNIISVDTEVVPVNRRGKYGGVQRPLFSALKNEKAARLGIVLPHWKDALKRYLEKRHEEIF